MKKRIRLTLPPSIAGAKKTTSIAPKGSSTPSKIPKVKGPMRIPTPDGGFVKKPSTALPQPPVRRTTKVLNYLKDKADAVLASDEYSPSEKQKMQDAVNTEERKVQESQAEYFQKLGQMQARQEAAEEEVRAYKAAARAAKARRLAGL